MNELNNNLLTENFRKFIQSSLDGFRLLNSEGVIIDVNSAYCTLLGLAESDLLGRPITDIEASSDKEWFTAHFNSIKDVGAIRYETSHKKQDGSILALEISEVYIASDKGCLYAIVRDISPRKFISNDLAIDDNSYSDSFISNEEKIKAILETIPYPIFAKNSDLKYIECNKAFETFTGKPREEIIGHDIYDIANKELADAYQKADLVILDEHSDLSYESNVLYDNGEFHDVIFHKNIIRKPDGKPVGIVGLIEDISDKKKSQEVLLASEKRFRALIENSYDAIILFDLHGTILYRTPSSERILGRDDTVVIGQSVMEHTHPDDRHLILSAFNSIMDNPKLSQKAIIRRLSENNEWRYLDCTLTNMLDEPSVNAIVANFQDVTEKIERHNEQKDRIAFQQALIDSIPYPVFIKNSDARFIGCNSAYEREFGTSRKYMIGKTVLDLEYLPIEERVRFHHEDSQVIAEASQRSYELPIEYADGKVHSTIYTVDGFKLFDGSPGGLIGILVDISERKAVQEELIRINKIQSLILDNSSLGIALVKQRHFVWANQRISELLQLPVDEIKGKSTEMFAPSEKVYKEFMKEYDKLNHGEKSETVIQLKRNNGELFWCRFVGSAVDTNNPHEGSIWMLEDISERIANEEKIQLFIKELRGLNATKDKFFSIIAHDLKNPLGSFASTCEFLLSEYDVLPETEKIEFLTMLKESANNVYSLLENLLEWSRSQRGIIPFTPELCKLNLIVDNVIATCHSLAANKKIILQSAISDGLEVFADINMLITVIRNLTTNAIKFTKDNGWVRIEASYETNSKTVLIKVVDNGVGMNPDKLNELFQLGKNLTTSGTNNEKGSGLGLILCKEFIDKHNGDIWVESIINEGTTFYISIPAQRDGEIN